MSRLKDTQKKRDKYLFEDGISDEAALAEDQAGDVGTKGEDLVEKLDGSAGSGEPQPQEAAQSRGVQRRLYFPRTA